MKKHNKLIFITLTALLSIFAVSCLNDDDSEKREKEKRLIENYVLTNNITATPTASGLYYISQVEGTGATPKSTDFVMIKYKVTDLEGKFYDGTDKALAEQNKVYPYFALGGPMKIYAGANGFLKGIIEALPMMKEGGAAKLIMPSILAYNDYVPRIITLELVKVITDPMAYEREQITNFLDTATNHTMTLKDSTSGIYYIEKIAGTGDYPLTGDRVAIKYKGYLTDGRIFDKTENDTVFKFTVGGTGQNRVINGLDNGIRLMKKGGKATMVIPYYRGYGFDPIISYNQMIIPFFSTLVFDVEFVKFED